MQSNLPVATQKPTIDDIDRRRREVVEKFYEFKHSLQARKSKLEATKQFIQFKRLSDELMTWVSDKFDILKEQFLDDSSNIPIRKRKLQAFEVEIAAHNDLLSKLFLLYSKMEEDEYFVLGKAIDIYKTTESAYNELQSACQMRSEELKILSEKQTFIMEADEVIHSINLKLEDVESKFFVNGLVEVCELQAKYKTFSKGLSTDKARWEMLVLQGQTMLSSNHSDSDSIQAKLDDLITLWRILEDEIKQREINLDMAHEVYLYIDQTQEVQSWISDKVIVLSIEDIGKNLASSEALLRHHMILVRDLVVIEERVKQLDSESSTLMNKYSDYTDVVLQAQANLICCWEGLRRGADRRGFVLSESQKLHKFLCDSSDIITWISGMKQLIECDSTPTTLSEVNPLFDRILEYEGEIMAREESFLSIITFGNSLIASNHSQLSLISETIHELRLNIEALNTLLESKKRDLNQYLHILEYFRQCDHIENCLSRMLEDIRSYSSGNTWEETDALIKHLQNYDRTFHAYCNDIKNVESEASSLQIIFPEKNRIAIRISNLNRLKDDLYNLIRSYGISLHSMRDLHEYYRELVDMREWIQEQQLRILQDHVSDIEHSLQTHDVLVNEISIHSERIENFILKGNDIKDSSTFNVQHIVLEITELSNEWKSINDLCELKRNALVDDSLFIQYSAEIEKIVNWTDKIERVCNTEELGKDLISASIIQKYLKNLDIEIAAQTERFDNLVAKIREFSHRNHKSLPVLEASIEQISVKIEKTLPLYKERCEIVNKSCFSYRLFLQIKDEEDWVDDKSALLGSFNPINEFLQAQKLLKRFEILIADFNLRENRVLSLQNELKFVITLRHSSFCESTFLILREKWAKLKLASSGTKSIILNYILIQQYMSDCFEASVWLKEKESLLSSGIVAKDEDSVVSFIHKQETLISELKVYSQSIEDLKVQHQLLEFPPKDDSLLSSSDRVGYVRCLYNYVAGRTQELTMHKGDILELLSTVNEDWWKVKSSRNEIGYVPANYLERCLHHSISAKTPDYSNLVLRQSEIESLYLDVFKQCDERLQYLVTLHKRFCLEREIQEILLWIREANLLNNTIDNQIVDLEQAGQSKSIFDELITRIWSYESRVQQLSDNKVLLYNLGCEANLNILFHNWDQLLSSLDERKQVISKLLFLQKSVYDVEEIISWINDIDLVSSSEVLCKDLFSVQTLLREHEMVENTRTAIQSKLNQLQESFVPTTVSHLHVSLLAKHNEMIGKFDEFTKKLAERATHLEDCHYFFRFLTEQRDLFSWIVSLKGQFSLGELSLEISGTEALLMRIEELNIEILAREENIKSVNEFGTDLIGKQHVSTHEISLRLEELNNSWLEINTLYSSEKSKFNQLLDLLIYQRDMEQCENWILQKIALIENLLTEYTLLNIQSTLKNIDELQNDLLLQEVTISELQQLANKLIKSHHYASAKIAERRVDVLQKWNSLRIFLSEKRENVMSIFRLHQYLSDIADIEGWISNKMELCGDIPLKAASFNSILVLIQKQDTSNSEVSLLRFTYTGLLNSIDASMNFYTSWSQVHLIELANPDGFIEVPTERDYADLTVTAHSERIAKSIEFGKQLMEIIPSHEQSQMLQLRISSLQQVWNLLLSTMKERKKLIQNIKDDFDFSLAYRSRMNWIEETTLLLSTKEVIKDVDHAEFVIDSLKDIKIELDSRKSQIFGLNVTTIEISQREYSDVEIVLDKKARLQCRFEEIFNLYHDCQLDLQRDLMVLKYIRSLDNESSWLHENMLLTSVDDFGKDLIGVQRLRKKHQRFQSELLSHKNMIFQLVSQGKSLDIIKNQSYTSIIEEKCEANELYSKRLQTISNNRTQMLIQSESYQQFSANIQEEESWLSVKSSTLSILENIENIEVLYKNSVEFEAFASDIQAHHCWIGDLTAIGNKLMNEGNSNTESIKASSFSIVSKLKELENRFCISKERLNTSRALLEYAHRIDLVDSWIYIRELDIQSIDYGEGSVISYIENLITKHSGFENSIQIFQQSGIDILLQEKDILNTSDEYHITELISKLKDIEIRWENLLKNGEERKYRLIRSLELSKKVDDLFLHFSKKASIFYSWVENAKEDLVEPVNCSSFEEIEQLKCHDVQFHATVAWAYGELKQLQTLDREIRSFTSLENPYTWYTTESLQESWKNLQDLIVERQAALAAEYVQQSKNDKSKRFFAEKANTLSSWLFATRKSMIENSGQLSEQLDFARLKLENILQKQADLTIIEKLSFDLHNEMILDNSYTQHTAVSLTQQWYQLSQLGRRMIHSLQQQLLSKNMTGVSEEDMKEFQTLFNVYDKDRSGQLDEAEFKSCLIALGYSLQFMDNEQKDSEFENILDQVDPHRLGYISLNDFMSFHISRRTEKVKSREELEEAFRAITADERSNYVSKDELYRALGSELQSFCLQHMKEISNSSYFDYLTFTQSLFIS